MILFDEIEKAHPEIWNTLLQVLEDGRLTDGQGHTVDFRNTVIIMTSNIGTEFAQRGGTIGFNTRGKDAKDLGKDYGEIEESLKHTFRPEFLNRIDEVIIFHVLSRDQIKLIVDLQMKEIAGRLKDQGIEIQLTDTAREWLAKEGFDPQFGARPLRRTLQRKVESPLSRKLLAGEFKSGDVVVVDADEKEGIVFTRKSPEPIEQPTLMETPPAPVAAV